MRLRLSQSRQKKIIRAHLQEGLHRNEIARTKKEGGSTVSREIERFENEVEKNGIEQASENYGVSQIVQELHEIAVLKKEKKLTNEDLSDGAGVASTLKRLKVEPTIVEQFVKEVLFRVKEKDYSASRIVDDCAEIGRLESKYEIPFEQLKRKYDTMGSQIDRRREEASELRKEIEDKRKEYANLVDEYDVTKKELDEFTETKKVLLERG